MVFVFFMPAFTYFPNYFRLSIYTDVALNLARKAVINMILLRYYTVIFADWFPVIAGSISCSIIKPTMKKFVGFAMQWHNYYNMTQLRLYLARHRAI